MVIWNIIFLQFRRQAWEQAIGEGISFWRWPPQTSWPTLIVFFFPQMQLFVYLPWNLFQSYANKKKLPLKAETEILSTTWTKFATKF